MNIDSRAGWVIVDTSVPAPKWALVDFVYKDERESNGNPLIYVTVLNEDGSPASGVTVWQGWPDGRAPAPTISGACNFFMSGDSSFAPDRGERGPYFIEVESENQSDVVEGLGLPLKRHVNYYLTFRRVKTDNGGQRDEDIRALIAGALRAAAEFIERG